jgi:NAD(P)-dependent dehydrogenase (short-subunit alcohol dehydrogenase family)
VSFHALDVTREDDWIAATDQVARDFGKLDILVNNAGVALLRTATHLV